MKVIVSPRQLLLSIIVLLYTALVVFQSGCVSNFIPVCRQTVPEPGVYQVNFTEPSGTMMVAYVSSDRFGAVTVGPCTSLVGDPVLLPPNSPPECGHARPSISKLVESSQDFVDISIEGVSDPDGDPVFIQIDSILQNEPTGGLFPTDKSPDAEGIFGPVARVRPERDPAGNGRVYTINFTASQPQGGFCQNAVTVCVPLIAGGECGDNRALFDSTKRPEIDLAVTLTDSPDPVDRGAEITYTVTVTNPSSLLATDVGLTDRLPFPTAAEFVSSSMTCSHQNDTLGCSLGNLNPGESRTESIVLRALAGGVITNHVAVGSFNSIDPDLTNNSATAITTVNLNADADLAVAIFDNPDPVVRGNAVTYTVTVVNRGPAQATGVTLTDLLPPLEMNDSDISASQGTCSRLRREGKIICNFGTLPQNASAILIFTGFTSSTGSIFNTATLTANEMDLDLSNNSVTEFTSVQSP